MTKIIAILLFAISAPALAADIRLENGGGVCKGHRSEEGTWWQEGQQHSLQLEDRCGSVGLSFGTPISNVRVAGRYVSLGQFATHAIANADDNDEKSRRGQVSADPRRAECGLGFHADCLYKWDGSGGAQGFLGAIQWEPLRLGPVHLGGEAGLFLYRARWRETVHPIDCPGNACWQMQIDQRVRWQHAPELGVTARWEYVYVAARRYWVMSHAPITAGFKQPVDQMEVGLSIPFSL